MPNPLRLFPAHTNFSQEVSLSTLYVAAKLHDCLKKPRDLILASYAIRQPDMLKGRLALSVDPALFDPKQLESERKRMLSVERLVLETLCFNLMVGAEGGGSPGLDAFGLIIKLGRKAGCELTAKALGRTC
jgi:CTD kinase subunit beta